MNDDRRPPIYLDYNATTPLAPEVVDAMRPFLSGLFGNPSSAHPFGADAKRALETARRDVAKLLGAAAEEIVFTSGGTEANNLAIKGALALSGPSRQHIICSAVEHPAVIQVVRHLERKGCRVSVVGVDAAGRVNPEDIAAAIGPETALVSVMLANNEVGTLQAVREIAEIAHASGAYMHTDAAQAVGKISVNVEDLEVDLLSVAGHKFYAPKGIGALYIRSGTRIERQMEGADHEHSLRPGTENVMFAVALGRACERAPRVLKEEMPRIEQLRDRFEHEVLGLLGNERVRVNASASRRLPNTSSMSFRDVEANTLLAEIGDRVAASAGAACHAGGVDVSPVLMAMGIAEEWAMGTVRFSLGVGTTSDEIDEARDVVCRVASRLSGSLERPVLEVDASDAVRLTRYTHGMGCACKIRPQILERILSHLPARLDENVLVDAATADDAGVYRLSDEVALVQTADFFTPIVDSPYAFGAISAANSLSDIYAMGARPLFALNIAGFPSQRLPETVLREILQGAADKCAEAGISIIGGHTVEDTEPKFGLAVTGLVHPMRILRNNGAKAGDALVLTKPLGTGIIATGIKRGLAETEDSVEVTALMQELNKAAAETLVAFTVHACTDVTGFGLLGHLFEMTAGSHVEAEISAERVPVLKAARRLAEAGVVPGGTKDNLEYVRPHVRFEASAPQSLKWILADAQTSGGLLISIESSEAPALLDRLLNKGVAASQIGIVSAPGTGTIHVGR